MTHTTAPTPDSAASAAAPVVVIEEAWKLTPPICRAGAQLGAPLQFAAAATALVALALLAHAQMLAGLKAAGLTGTPPPNSALITKLIGDLTSNWLWLVGTGVGLVLVLLGGMLAFGSRSAPDVLFRVIAGIGIILVVIPSALA